MDEANHQTDTTDQTNLTEDRPGQPDRSDRARPTRPTTPINHANPTDLIDPADRRTDQANQIGTDSPTDPTNPTSHYQTNQTDRTRRLEHPPTVGMVGASGVCVWWAGRKYRSCVGLHSQLLLQKVPFWKVSSNEDQTKLQVSFPYGLQRPNSNVAQYRHQGGSWGVSFPPLPPRHRPCSATDPSNRPEQGRATHHGT